MTLANKVTVFRIVAIPLFMIALFEKQLAAARLIFLVSIATDAIDGAIARLRRERTPLGTFLDPLADKLLLLAAYVSFAALNWIPIWVLIVVLSRDLLIVLGWGIVYLLTGNSKIQPRPIGKITTALQMFFALSRLMEAPPPIQKTLLVSMVIASCLSLGDYLWQGNLRLSEST